MAQLIINNLIHPDLPLRNNISNILFSIIAVLIFINSLRDAYFSDTFADGLKAGFWSGISSGAIACFTAMVLIVFGMKYILLDPLKLQEWSEVAETSGSPGMAVYYAYRTFSGAIMHLFILGCPHGQHSWNFWRAGRKDLLYNKKAQYKITNLAFRKNPSHNDRSTMAY